MGVGEAMEMCGLGKRRRYRYKETWLKRRPDIHSANVTGDPRQEPAIRADPTATVAAEYDDVDVRWLYAYVHEAGSSTIESELYSSSRYECRGRGCYGKEQDAGGGRGGDLRYIAPSSTSHFPPFRASPPTLYSAGPRRHRLLWQQRRMKQEYASFG